MKPGTVKVQCISNIEKLLNTSVSPELTPSEENKGLCMRVNGDYEQHRSHGRLVKADMAHLTFDVTLLAKVLNSTEPIKAAAMSNLHSRHVAKIAAADRDWKRFDNFVEPQFLKQVRQVTSPEEVCALLSVLRSMMEVIVSALAPGLQLEQIVDTFREVIFTLLANRNQETARATKQSLGNLAIQTIQPA